MTFVHITRDLTTASCGQLLDCSTVPEIPNITAYLRVLLLFPNPQAYYDYYR
ncbi:MAG: hypothetical protein GWP04_00380 [Gammaproteobacteria bacterium]|nr:hypothetical protein [Gammaproteobacteria bacterium]